MPKSPMCFRERPSARRLEATATIHGSIIRQKLHRIDSASVQVKSNRDGFALKRAHIVTRFPTYGLTDIIAPDRNGIV